MISTWDENHYFPVLLDDTEYTLKFLRAFQPSRVLRYPRRAEPIQPEDLWNSALSAVGRSWIDSQTGVPVPPGDQVPKLSRPTPPGVVFSDAKSPALASAVALAAGRFQPLVRLEVPNGLGDVLNMEQAQQLVVSVERSVQRIIPGYGGLGDACDFLTIAAPWPFAYSLRLPALETLYKQNGNLDISGKACLDDLIGRDREMKRWAFAGRLLGDERQCLYQAMCALFLPPESAMIFNAYPPDGQMSEYQVDQAATRLSREGLRVDRVTGDTANLSGWHRAFDPINRRRLVLINSSGSPQSFNLRGEIAGVTDDIAITDPTAVLMIHSYSAENLRDGGTIGGRWLENGAFLYYGSINEPYLAAFRTPTLVANLIADHLPFSAAVRQMPGEPFAIPWRLIYVGDPLYHLPITDHQKPRETWSVTDAWPAYQIPPIPRGSEVTERAKLDWSVRKAIVDAATRGDRPPDELLVRAVRSIQREGLPENLRPIFDALLADVLFSFADRGEYRRAYAGVPGAEWPAAVQRWWATSLFSDLQRLIEAGQTIPAGSLWSTVISSSLSDSRKAEMTRRVGRLFEDRGRLREWQGVLRTALGRETDSMVIKSELDRIGPKLEPAPQGSRGR